MLMFIMIDSNLVNWIMEVLERSCRLF